MGLTKFDQDTLANIVGALQNRVILANEEGTLPDLLRDWGFSDFVPEDDGGGFDDFDERPDGDIIVLGDLQIQREHLLGIANMLGIDKSRFQFRGYNEVKNRSCQVWRYNPAIAVILCGALPHKADGMGDNTSLIAALENEPGYPPVRKFRQGNGALKISKTKFREVLWDLMNEGILRAG